LLILKRKRSKADLARNLLLQPNVGELLTMAVARAKERVTMLPVMVMKMELVIPSMAMD
jgi:hypothetical protein